MANIFVSIYRWSKKPPSREGLFLRSLNWTWVIVFLITWLTTELNCRFYTTDQGKAIDSFYLHSICLSLFFHCLLFPAFVIFKKKILKIALGLAWLAAFLYPIISSIYMYREFFHPFPIQHKTRFILQILFDLAMFIAYVFIVVRKANKFNEATGSIPK